MQRELLSITDILQNEHGPRCNAELPEPRHALIVRADHKPGEVCTSLCKNSKKGVGNLYIAKGYTAKRRMSLARGVRRQEEEEEREGGWFGVGVNPVSAPRPMC